MQHHHPVKVIDPSAKGADSSLQLAPDENVIASLDVDLDASLRFGRGRLVLTETRLLSLESTAGSWSEWPLHAGLSLRHADHGGVGSIELHDANQRLAQWRFTLGANVLALRWLTAFEQQQARLQAGGSVESDADELLLCPSCKAPLPPDSEECPTCARELHTPPSTWVLLRLWRFAKPYQGQLLLGFLLMLGSTGATLVSPYLAMPSWTRS